MNNNNMEEHISWARKTLANQSLTDGERAEALNILANTLFARAQSAAGADRSTNAIDEAVYHLRLAAHLRPRPKSLNALANVLFWRYRNGLSGRYDLEEAVLLGRKAVESAAPDATHPDLHVLLYDLASFLGNRYEQDDDQVQDQLVLIRKAVVELLPPSHYALPDCLFELGHALHIRFQHAKAPCASRADDLDECIACYRRSLDLQPIPPADLDTRLDILAELLETRFQKRGDEEYMEEHVSLRKRVLELRPAWHAERAEAVRNLGHALLLRYANGCPRSDAKYLHESISLKRRYVELRPPHHPGRSAAMVDLAKSLEIRFDLTRDRCDFEEAVSLYREALTLAFPVNPKWADLLKNFAFTLIVRFEDYDSGDKRDVEHAVAVAREALRIRQESESIFELSEYLNQLGYALLVLIRDTDAGVGALEECISLHRRALELRQEPHIERIGSLTNLAASLFIRFKNGGAIDDLHEAISHYRPALRDHVHKLEFIPTFSALADALETRYAIDNVVYQDDIREAADLRKRVDRFDSDRSREADENRALDARLAAEEKIIDQRRELINARRENDLLDNHVCCTPHL